VTNDPQRRYLSAPDAAAYLGVSTRTFYDYVRKNVRVVRIGTRVAFDVADLDAYAERQKESPPEPVDTLPRRTATYRPAPLRQDLTPATLRRLKSLREMKP